MRNWLKAGVSVLGIGSVPLAVFPQDGGRATLGDPVPVLEQPLFEYAAPLQPTAPPTGARQTLGAPSQPAIVPAAQLIPQPKTKPPLAENPLQHPPVEPAPLGPGAALSLADLEHLALQHNPSLVQAAQQVEGLLGKAQQARLWPNPVVGYTGEQIGLKGTAGEFQGGFIQQEIITACKRRISGAKYNQQARTMELRAVQQQLKVLNGVRIHYFRLLATGRIVQIRQGLLGNAEEDYRTTLELFNTGVRDRAEVLLAANRLSQARIDLQTENNRYQLLWRELAALLGVPDLPPGSLVGRLECDDPPLEWDASLQRILENSPELMALRSHIAFEELSLKRERVEPIPNITVRGGVGRNLVDKETTGMVEVSMPLPVWNWNQGNIRQVQADLARSVADVRREELQLQKKLAHEFNMYQNALVTVQMFAKNNIPNAFEAYEVYLDQYKQRRIPWFDVVRLHRNWLLLRLDYERHLLELRQQEVIITGLLVVDGLASPPAPPPPGHLEVSPQPR